MAVDDDGGDAARDDAVDGEAHELLGDDVAGVVPVEAEVVEHVKEAGPDDGERYGEGQHPPGVVGVDALLGQLPSEDQRTDQAATAMITPYQRMAKPANWNSTGSIVMWM